MQGLSILLVDDEDRFRLTLSKRLSERGQEVTAVSSGMEAIHQMKERDFDVVVLDVKMPGMDGLETLSELKKIRPDTEVILLTGHSSMDSSIEGIRLGAFHFILKPCDIDRLLELIHEAHAAKRAAQSGSR